jgi:hypothetical protein
MRVGMGLIKNEYGVYHVRRKVPKLLEGATARVLGVPKERVSWLKETLGTKDERQAKVLAKPIMMKFDRVLAQAEALLVEHPVRTELTDAEIKRIAVSVSLRSTRLSRPVGHRVNGTPVGAKARVQMFISAKANNALSDFTLVVSIDPAGHRSCPINTGIFVIAGRLSSGAPKCHHLEQNCEPE